MKHHRAPHHRSLKSALHHAGHFAKHTINRVLHGAHKAYTMANRAHGWLSKNNLLEPAKALLKQHAPEDVQKGAARLKHAIEGLPEGVKEAVKKGRLEKEDALSAARDLLQRA